MLPYEIYAMEMFLQIQVYLSNYLSIQCYDKKLRRFKNFIKKHN